MLIANNKKKLKSAMRLKRCAEDLESALKKNIVFDKIILKSVIISLLSFIFKTLHYIMLVSMTICPQKMITQDPEFLKLEEQSLLILNNALMNVMHMQMLVKMDGLVNFFLFVLITFYFFLEIVQPV